MSEHDTFTIITDDYLRMGLKSVGYKRFAMEVLDAKSIFGAGCCIGEAVFKVPSELYAFLLPNCQDVNISNAKTGLLELELGGSGSAISVFLKNSDLPPTPAYDNYYPPCRWSAAMVCSMEMVRGDELIVCSKSAEILSVAVYGWAFVEDTRFEEAQKIKKEKEADRRREEADKEKIVDKQKSFWKSLRCLYKVLRKQ